MSDFGGEADIASGLFWAHCDAGDRSHPSHLTLGAV